MTATTSERKRRPSFINDLRTTPNLITLSRVGLLLVAGYLFFSGRVGVAIVVAVVAGLTDYLDGWWARRTNQVTRLGELLDQFCDILYESMVLYLAVASYHFLPLWVVPAYLGRELWVTTVRRFMAGNQFNISTNLAGKMKTNFVMWGFFPTFLSLQGILPSLEPGIAYLGRGSILFGIFLGYVSAADYTRQLAVAYDRLVAADPDRRDFPPATPGEDPRRAPGPR